MEFTPFLLDWGRMSLMRKGEERRDERASLKTRADFQQMGPERTSSTVFALLQRERERDRAGVTAWSDWVQ